MKKIIVGFIATNFIVFFCSGKILREDVVSYSLDYHELKEKEKTTKQEKDRELFQTESEREKKRIQSWSRKKKKIDELLRNVLITLEFQTTYDDNIYREKNAKSDLVNAVSLSANYISRQSATKQGKTDFFLDFQGNGLGYTTSKNPNATETNIRAGMNYALSEKYGALLECAYAKKQQLASETSSSGADSGKLIDNNINTLEGTFSAGWGRFPWSVSYMHSDSKFEKEYKTSDDTQDIIRFTPGFKISPKTEIFCEYENGAIDYPERETDNYSYTKYLVGARGKIAPKITGIVKFGWGEYDYDSGDTKETEEMNLNFRYRPSKRFVLKGISGKTISATTYTDNDSSENTYIGLAGIYFPPFNKKLTLKGSTKMTNIKLSGSQVEDDILLLKLGLGYGFNRHLALSLDYEHEVRESTDVVREYERNKTILTGTWEF